MCKSNFCLSVKHIIKLTNANRSHRSTLELLVISDFQGASHLSSIQQAPCEGSITVPANGFWDHCIMALRAGLIASANQSTPMLPRTICLLDASPDSQMSIVTCFVYRFHSMAAPQGEAPLVQPICGCKAHCSLQCRPVHTLQCPVQYFTITTFFYFYKRIITSATSWNDMHWDSWLSVISTAWLQQCQSSSCCLCTQHLMLTGCEAHCSLQCRHVHTLPCPLQHLTITTFF